MISIEEMKKAMDEIEVLPGVFIERFTGDFSDLARRAAIKSTISREEEIGEEPWKKKHFNI